MYLNTPTKYNCVEQISPKHQTQRQVTRSYQKIQTTHQTSPQSKNYVQTHRHFPHKKKTSSTYINTTKPRPASCVATPRNLTYPKNQSTNPKDRDAHKTHRRKTYLPQCSPREKRRCVRVQYRSKRRNGPLRWRMRASRARPSCGAQGEPAVAAVAGGALARGTQHKHSDAPARGGDGRGGAMQFPRAEVHPEFSATTQSMRGGEGGCLRVSFAPGVGGSVRGGLLFSSCAGDGRFFGC